LLVNVLQTLAEQDQVGVVGDKATRGPQVQDVAGLGADVAPGVDMRHYIVPQPPLVFGGAGQVNVVEGATQGIELFGADAGLAVRIGQPQLGLGLG
jgi:hypothetical protein